MSWIRTEKRAAIYRRDECSCAYCGQAVVVGAHVSVPGAATIDHIRPRAKGGSNQARNLVTACVKCNSRKQDMGLRQWLALLAAEGHNRTEIARRIRNLTRRTLQ